MSSITGGYVLQTNNPLIEEVVMTPQEASLNMVRGFFLEHRYNGIAQLITWINSSEGKDVAQIDIAYIDEKGLSRTINVGNPDGYLVGVTRRSNKWPYRTPFEELRCLAQRLAILYERKQRNPDTSEGLTFFQTIGFFSEQCGRWVNGDKDIPPTSPV